MTRTSFLAGLNSPVLLAVPLGMIAPALAPGADQLEQVQIGFPSGQPEVQSFSGDDLDRAAPAVSRLIRGAPGDHIKCQVEPDASKLVAKKVHFRIVAILETKKKKCLKTEVTRQEWVIERTLPVDNDLLDCARLYIHPESAASAEMIPLSMGETHRARLAENSGIRVAAEFPPDVVFARRQPTAAEFNEHIQPVIDEMRRHPNVKQPPAVQLQEVLPGNVGDQLRVKLSTTRAG